MIFKEYSPLEDKMFKIMDNNGKIVNQKYFPNLSDDEIINAYKDILFERTADQMVLSFQRQGRIFTYPPSFGQEAIHIAAGKIIKDEDWLVPAFRELGAYLAKGATLKDIFLYYMGYEEGTAFRGAKNILPYAVPIASQLPHAVGIAYAIKFRKEKKAVFAFVGDGGTSEGDFHEALNFASVWKVPVVFTVQNNQYAISTSKINQTASINFAIKGMAYNIPSIKVDGNDFFAIYVAYSEAKKHVLEGNGPILIEAVTYRKGAHTTSDDPTKYRLKKEEDEWDKTDPQLRLRKYLNSKKLFPAKEEEKIVADFKKEIERQFIEAENYPSYTLDEVFNHLYDEMPDDLKQQKNHKEKFLRWLIENKKTQKV